MLLSWLYFVRTIGKEETYGYRMYCSGVCAWGRDRVVCTWDAFAVLVVLEAYQMISTFYRWVRRRIGFRPATATCAVPINPDQAQRRGILWVVGAFVFCPCHLPLTLTVLATMLGGTALGASLGQFPYLAGAIITLVWAIGTWRGIRLLRDANRFAQSVVRRQNRAGDRVA